MHHCKCGNPPASPKIWNSFWSQPPRTQPRFCKDVCSSSTKIHITTASKQNASRVQFMGILRNRQHPQHQETQHLTGCMPRETCCRQKAHQISPPRYLGKLSVQLAAPSMHSALTVNNCKIILSTLHDAAAAGQGNLGKKPSRLCKLRDWPLHQLPESKPHVDCPAVWLGDRWTSVT